MVHGFDSIIIPLNDVATHFRGIIYKPEYDLSQMQVHEACVGRLLLIRHNFH